MANFIKFYKQAQAPAHLNGAIWFDNTSNLIKVSDGSNWKEFGGIVNATSFAFKSSNSFLTPDKILLTSPALATSEKSSVIGVALFAL